LLFLSTQLDAISTELIELESFHIIFYLLLIKLPEVLVLLIATCGTAREVFQTTQHLVCCALVLIDEKFK